MELYGKTDVGRMREYNQDAFENTVLSPSAVLTVVCDGMGGANAGNIASKMAVEIITDYIKKSYFDEMDSASLEVMLRSAISSANIEIYDLANKKEEYEGMGTTAVVAVVRGTTAYIAHVGDSRAYLISETAQQITRDHSIVQNLIERGELTEEEARVHPHKNVITRAVGTREEIQSDFNEINIKGKMLLICTDGLCGMLTNEEIYSTVKGSETNLAVDKLIELANAKMSTDNITVTIVTE